MKLQTAIPAVVFALVLFTDVAWGNDKQLLESEIEKSENSARKKEPRQSSASACSTSNFQKMDSCCLVPSGPLFTSDVLRGCNPNKRFLNGWANTLMINRQISKKTGTLDMSSRPTISRLCSVAPVLNCLYNNASVFLSNSSSFYDDAMRFFVIDRFIEFADPWFDAFYFLIEPFGEFETMNDIIKPEYQSVMCPGRRPRDPRVNTTLLPLILTQYLENQIIALCPEPATPFKASDGCTRGLAAHKTCTASLNKLLFKDDFYNYTITSVQRAREALAAKGNNIFNYSELLAPEKDEDFEEGLEEEKEEEESWY